MSAIKKVIGFAARAFSRLCPPSLLSQKRVVSGYFYTQWVKRGFSGLGEGSILYGNINLRGTKYITIGKGVCIGRSSTLIAWDRDRYARFNPRIVIEDHANIGEYAHISATRHIHIGKGVLTGRWVTIVDNAHGETNLALPPMERPLFSKGPVTIGDNVWIGDKVTVLPNVAIGEHAVIGANSVVTADIPAYAIAGGIPAKVIKINK